MKFNYQARTQDGQVQGGVVEASSREVAIGLLQKQDLYVTVLEEISKPPIYAKRITIFETISRKDVVLFSRQLSIMFKSKVPLVEALQVLGEQNQNPDLKDKILTISEEVEGGTVLSTALAQHPKLFSSFYIAMVKAGEASGKLSESLNYLADHLEREYHLMSKVKGAMVYPILILLFAIMVVIVMVFFVIPNLTKVLEETGQEMPFITSIVISFTEFVKKWFWLGLIISLAFIFYIIRYSRSEEGKRFFDGLFLKTPSLGSFLKMLYLSRFAENLSTLISGGLPIAQSLDITADIIGNSVYREVIFNAREGVKKGDSVSSVLRLAPEIFPPMFCQMVLVGEKTGTLDRSLMDMVDFYQKETERMVETMLSVLEPAMIMFLGVVVGGLMFAILTPLYKMMSF